MARRKVVMAASFIATAILAWAVLFMRQHDTKTSKGDVEKSTQVAQADVADVPAASKMPDAIDWARIPRGNGHGIDPTGSNAKAAYELVEINLRCQIDREASTTAGHVRSTTVELCKDLLLKPLSREEVFEAITYAAENGHVRAQLDYSLYASRIFEDERSSLDPNVIRDYKENTVRFLESAGSAGESQAYLRLSDIYKNGALASKDPVMAYAYAEAYFRTGSSRYGGSFLNNASDGLDPAQIQRGKKIADQILNRRSSLR